ncbi:unnamed protein product [Paramecium octaurelia]|uniref:Uncharacterized protein n=1 Tax=Paramecium octaurelia TaxID=43137 RepID=A0A8S1SNT9_PAROT|nr:unnamed protein product [Paramecium octaurelia]
MFKPKKGQQQQQQQPFYLSWFTNQGENLKRGGTAPQQSRKERLQLKSPYQQPLTTVIHMAPNPYNRIMQAPKTNSNIQQISKIYAQKSQLSKRKSQEYERQRYDLKSQSQQSRAFTQQGIRPLRLNDGRPQTQQNLIEHKLCCDNLGSDEEQQEQLTPRDDKEDIDLDNIGANQFINDCFSNESNEADSEDHQNFQLPIQNDEQIQNKSLIKEEPITSLRNNQNQINRPQTSEGGRRKRFMNSLNQADQNYEKKKETECELLEYEANIILEEEQDNQEIVDTNLKASPKELISIRSGYRRKQNDLNELMETNNEIRPPSRHKTPPKATGLELPLENCANNVQRDSVDIPIKNMYAQINDEKIKEENDGEFDLDFFKMNNKMNFKKFQQNDFQGYHTDDANKLNQQRHPKSANLKQNQMRSPLNSQITSAHLRNEAQIVIKYNNSSAIQRNNEPIKVPFQTSLGQDFLRLFANHHMEQ